LHRYPSPIVAGIEVRPFILAKNSCLSFLIARLFRANYLSFPKRILQEDDSMTETRPRGRPRGTGKNDKPCLAWIADLLVAEPTLKPTTAMRRVIASRNDWGTSDESLLRRWQVKWQADRASLLVAAQKRARPKLTFSAVPLSPSAIGVSAAVSSFVEQQNRWMKAMKQIEESPWGRAMREIENSPWVKRIREIENSPWMKRMREIENSPWMKRMREIEGIAQNDPFIRMVTDIGRSSSQPFQPAAS
jgi:hypothetical protein